MMRFAVIALWTIACSGADGTDEPGATGSPVSSFEGTVTMDEYDWFAVEPYLGVVQFDLESGEKVRLADGRQPAVHPDGPIAFVQSCGDRVSRVAVRQTSGLVDVLTPCSSELPIRQYTEPDFTQAKLSPDRSLVAVEVLHFVDFEFTTAVSVFEEGDPIAEFDGLYNPTWTADGRLLMAGEGLYLANPALTDVTRIDGDQLNAFVGNPAVSPVDEDLVVFEFNQAIWQVRLDGSDLRELVVGSRRLRFPTWSPDGSALVYLGLTGSDMYDKALYFTDLDQGESSFVDLTPSFGTDPSVVPNGPLSWW